VHIHLVDSHILNRVSGERYRWANELKWQGTQLPSYLVRAVQSTIFVRNLCVSVFWEGAVCLPCMLFNLLRLLIVVCVCIVWMVRFIPKIMILR
jgi:hypothetical protein